MCCRYTLKADLDRLARLFAIRRIVRGMEQGLKARYNIAPAQPVAVVRESAAGARELTACNWGLVPAWTKDVEKGARMVNARSETAAEKPAFRSALRYRRCLIPASGYYEWQDRGAGQPRQPFYISPEADKLMALAGIWEHWQSPDGSEIESCAILTTAANERLAEIHPRMPVVLDQNDFDCWLEPSRQRTDGIKHLLKPCPPDWLLSRPVSPLVNSTRNDGPELLDEIDPESGVCKAPFQGELF